MLTSSTGYVPAFVKRARRSLLIATVVLTVVVTACGDDEPETPAAEEPTTQATTTTTAAAAATQKCKTVAFTPNSEDAASDITATGLSCTEAEAFVRVAGQRTSAGGPAQVNVEGYRCVQTDSQEDPLPRSTYECENAGKKVTFVRS